MLVSGLNWVATREYCRVVVAVHTSFRTRTKQVNVSSFPLDTDASKRERGRKMN